MLQRLRAAAGGQGECRCRPRQRRLEQFDFEEVAAVLAAWRDAQQCELAGDVVCGDLVTPGSSFAPFEQVIGEEADVRTNAVGAEFRFSGNRCRGHNGEREDDAAGEAFPHSRGMVTEH